MPTVIIRHCMRTNDDSRRSVFIYVHIYVEYYLPICVVIGGTVHCKSQFIYVHSCEHQNSSKQETVVFHRSLFFLLATARSHNVTNILL